MGTPYTLHVPSELPLCPNCGREMKLTRRWEGVGVLPNRSTFACDRCGIAFAEIVTGESSIPERVSALHYEPYDRAQ